jgi:hypothetical protein
VRKHWFTNLRCVKPHSHSSNVLVEAPQSNHTRHHHPRLFRERALAFTETRAFGTRYDYDDSNWIWFAFDPQSGRVQSGQRPALVPTPARYNGLVGLLIACPLTKHAKWYPAYSSTATTRFSMM